MKKRIPFFKISNYKIANLNENNNNIKLFIDENSSRKFIGVFYRNITSDLQDIIDKSFDYSDPTILSPIGYFFEHTEKDLVLVYNFLQTFSIKNYMTRDFLIAFKVAFGVCHSLLLFNNFVCFKSSQVLIDFQNEPRFLPFFNVQTNNNNEENSNLYEFVNIFLFDINKKYQTLQNSDFFLSPFHQIILDIKLNEPNSQSNTQKNEEFQDPSNNDFTPITIESIYTSFINDLVPTIIELRKYHEQIKYVISNFSQNHLFTSIYQQQNSSFYCLETIFFNRPDLTIDQAFFELKPIDFLNFGLIYLKGEIATRNIDKALTLFTKATSLSESWFYIAICCLSDEKGNDRERAMKFFKLSADKGHDLAAFNYAKMTNSIEYYQIAAERGVKEAFYQISKIFLTNGDVDKAIEFAEIGAQKFNDEQCIKYLDLIRLSIQIQEEKLQKDLENLMSNNSNSNRGSENLNSDSISLDKNDDVKNDSAECKNENLKNSIDEDTDKNEDSIECQIKNEKCKNKLDDNRDLIYDESEKKTVNSNENETFVHDQPQLSLNNEAINNDQTTEIKAETKNQETSNNDETKTNEINSNQNQNETKNQQTSTNSKIETNNETKEESQNQQSSHNDQTEEIEKIKTKTKNQEQTSNNEKEEKTEEVKEESENQDEITNNDQSETKNEDQTETDSTQKDETDDKYFEFELFEPKNGKSKFENIATEFKDMTIDDLLHQTMFTSNLVHRSCIYCIIGFKFLEVNETKGAQFYFEKSIDDTEIITNGRSSNLNSLEFTKGQILSTTDSCIEFDKDLTSFVSILSNFALFKITGERKFLTENDEFPEISYELYKVTKNKEYLTKAAKMGHIKSMHKLGMIKEAADLGYSKSQFEYAQYLLHKKFNHEEKEEEEEEEEEDDDRMVRLYMKKAADSALFSINSNENKENFYHCEVDRLLSFLSINKSDNICSISDASYYAYEYSKFIEKEDFDESIHYLKMSAELEVNADSMLKYALYLKNRKSDTQGHLNYLIKSASYGSGDAYFALSMHIMSVLNRPNRALKSDTTSLKNLIKTIDQINAQSTFTKNQQETPTTNTTTNNNNNTSDDTDTELSLLVEKLDGFAVSFLFAASKLGSPEAQLCLSHMMCDGLGVAADEQASMRLLKKAAKSGRCEEAKFEFALKTGDESALNQCCIDHYLPALVEVGKRQIHSKNKETQEEGERKLRFVSEYNEIQNDRSDDSNISPCFHLYIPESESNRFRFKNSVSEAQFELGSTFYARQKYSDAFIYLSRSIGYKKGSALDFRLHLSEGSEFIRKSGHSKSCIFLRKKRNLKRIRSSLKMIASMLLSGRGVERDEDEAAQIYRAVNDDESRLQLAKMNMNSNAEFALDLITGIKKENQESKMLATILSHKLKRDQPLLNSKNKGEIIDLESEIKGKLNKPSTNGFLSFFSNGPQFTEIAPKITNAAQHIQPTQTQIQNGTQRGTSLFAGIQRTTSRRSRRNYNDEDDDGVHFGFTLTRSDDEDDNDNNYEFAQSDEHSTYQPRSNTNGAEEEEEEEAVDDDDDDDEFSTETTRSGERGDHSAVRRATPMRHHITSHELLFPDFDGNEVQQTNLGNFSSLSPSRAGGLMSRLDTSSHHLTRDFAIGSNLNLIALQSSDSSDGERGRRSQRSERRRDSLEEFTEAPLIQRNQQEIDRDDFGSTPDLNNQIPTEKVNTENIHWAEPTGTECSRLLDVYSRLRSVTRGSESSNAGSSDDDNDIYFDINNFISSESEENPTRHEHHHSTNAISTELDSSSDHFEVIEEEEENEEEDNSFNF